MSIKFDTLLIELLEDIKETLQDQIDEDKKRLAAPPICEFCETPYNESKTNHCYQCECMREGRMNPTMDTYREQIKASDKYLCEKTDLRTVGLTERDDDSEEEEKIGRAEERYTEICIEQDEGGPVYD